MLAGAGRQKSGLFAPDCKTFAYYLEYLTQLHVPGGGHHIGHILPPHPVT